MSPERAIAARAFVQRTRMLARASWDLLRLELRLLTGNRLLVLVLVNAAIFVAFAVMQYFRDERWEGSELYQLVLMPGMVPAIALGMATVMAERDGRQLEMTFVSPGGRYRAWAYRLAALLLCCLTSSMALALATRLLLTDELPPISSALHATVTLTCVAWLTAFLSVVFNGASTAGLVSAGLSVLSWVMLHHGGELAKFDLFLNPLARPPETLDPDAWFRVLVFNRGLLLSIAALSALGLLTLLQRRERLL